MQFKVRTMLSCRHVPNTKFAIRERQNAKVAADINLTVTLSLFHTDANSKFVAFDLEQIGISRL